MSVRILQGSALDVLRTLEAESVQLVCTSPPYLGLRSYGTAPQVWGGDPEHEHSWDTVPSPGSRSSDTNPGPMQHAGNTGREKLTSDLCPCGAWRGELGLEPTPALFIEHLVAIFREVRRVLRPDGLVFCNLGDSYTTGASVAPRKTDPKAAGDVSAGVSRIGSPSGIPAKNLLLIPQRFAIAMQDDGWIVRSCISWCKTSAMPESVRDRPTSAWEPIWMFAKSRAYYYDADAVRTNVGVPMEGKASFRTGGAYVNGRGFDNGAPKDWQHDSSTVVNTAGANLRNYWLLGPSPLKEAHYASFPPEIPRRCILAGTSEKGACPACGASWVRSTSHPCEACGAPIPQQGKSCRACGHVRDWKAGRTARPEMLATDWSTPGIGTPRLPGGFSNTNTGTDWQPSCQCPPADPRPCVVLDPFGGSGTTGLVADRLGRDAVLIELNPEYAEMARRRLEQDAGSLFGEPVAVEAPRQLDIFGEAS